MADAFPSGSSLDRILNAVALGTVVGGAGGLAQTIWQRPQAFGGAAATPTTVGDTIPTFARMGSAVTRSAGLIAAAALAFALGDNVAETVTGSRTPINGFVGGFCCGVVAGIKKQRSRIAIGYGLGFGVAGAALHASGGHMSQLSEQFNERKASFRKALE